MSRGASLAAAIAPAAGGGGGSSRSADVVDDAGPGTTTIVTVDAVAVDGGEIDPAAWTPIGATTWRHAVVPVQPGAHEVVGSQKRGVILHGYGDERSVSIPAGRAAHSGVGSGP